MSLQGKVAIVVGGAKEIGFAIAKKFAAEGARVLIVGLPADPVPEAVEFIIRMGGTADDFIGDVGVESQAEACVSQAISMYGQLDILVNASGTELELLPEGGTEHLRVSDFDREIYANIRAVFLMTKFALPWLKKSKGVVLSNGLELDGASLVVNPVHAASREWVSAFMKGIAAEGASHGVRANTVSTGPIVSEWPGQRINASTPMGRKGKPDEIANVYAFLASEEAGFVTGVTILVDGGMSLVSAPVNLAIKRGPELGRRNLEANH